MKKYFEQNLENFLTLPQYGVSCETGNDNMLKKDCIHLLKDGYHHLFNEYKTKNVHTLILEEMDSEEIILGPSTIHPNKILHEKQNINDIHEYIDMINFYFWDIGIDNYENILDNACHEYLQNVLISYDYEKEHHLIQKKQKKNIFFLFNTYKRNILYTINMLDKFDHDVDLVIILMNDVINKPTSSNISRQSKAAYLNFINSICEVVKIF
jgi:hypothetical protein